MTRQWWREAQELRGATLVALLAMAGATLDAVIPSHPDPSEAWFYAGVEHLAIHPGVWMWTLAVVALGLGVLQGCSDGASADRRSVLAHRPVGAGLLAAVKLGSGWAALTGVVGLPLLLAVAWNATLAPHPFVPACLVVPGLLLLAGYGCHAAGLASALASGGSWTTRVSLPLASLIVLVLVAQSLGSDYVGISRQVLIACVAGALLGTALQAWAAWAALAARGDPALAPPETRWIAPLATAVVLGWLGIVLAGVLEQHVVARQEHIDRSLYVFSPQGGVGIRHWHGPAWMIADDGAATVRPLDPQNPLDADVAAASPSAQEPVADGAVAEYVRFDTPLPCVAFHVDVHEFEDRQDPTHAVILYVLPTGRTLVRSLFDGRIVPMPVAPGDPPFPDRFDPRTIRDAMHALSFRNGSVGVDGRPWWWVPFTSRPCTIPGPWHGGMVLQIAETAPAPDQEQRVVQVLSDDGLRIFGPDGQVRERLPSPLPLSRFAWFHLARAADGGVWLASQDAAEGPVTLRGFDHDGTLRATRALPVLPDPRSENPSRVGHVVEALLPLVAGPIDLLHSLLLPGPHWHWDADLLPADARHAGWWRVVVSGALAAAALALTPSRSWAGRIGWGLLVLGFGVCGGIALLLHARTQGRAPCPSCGRPRPVTRRGCIHCAAPWAPEDPSRILVPLADVEVVP